MKKICIIILLVTTFLLWSSNLAAAPKAKLWARWTAHDSQSSIVVDHNQWGQLLSKYILNGQKGGINFFQYKQVSKQDKKELDTYLIRLQAVPVSKLNKNEQKAYWINFYNALTVKVILDHYPVQSIRDIDISPGFFSDGPWGKKLVEIEGEKVSLNDIEHRILRPIWKDNRVHYAVNCASMGCPNLQKINFTATNTEKLLNKGAIDYINHPRGANIQSNTLIVSSIFDWFQEDFGNSEKGVIQHLLKYAEGDLGVALKSFSGRIKYKYDWSLNE